MEVEKAQKATSHDLSNFKLSATNQFNTMNEVLDSRGNISKGNNKAVEEEVGKLREAVKELKVFVTESTRDINEQMELKEKETTMVYSKYDAKLA